MEYSFAEVFSFGSINMARRNVLMALIATIRSRPPANKNVVLAIPAFSSTTLMRGSLDTRLLNDLQDPYKRRSRGQTSRTSAAQFVVVAMSRLASSPSLRITNG
jgi:hypothetical protein